MPRQLASITATAISSTAIDLAFSYSGVYDGGSNSIQCGGGSGTVHTQVEWRNVTAGGAWTNLTDLSGGTTGDPDYSVTGLTAGTTYQFRATSRQERFAWNGEACDPVVSGTSATVTSSEVSTFAPVTGVVTATLGQATLAGSTGVRVAGAIAGALNLTGTASATHPVTGGLSSTLSAVTLTSGATHPVTGGITGALSASFSASGRVLNALSLAQTLNAAQAALTGLVLVGVRLNFTLDDVGCDLQAEQPWQRVSPVLTAWSPAPEGSTTWTPAADGSTIWN